MIKRLFHNFFQTLKKDDGAHFTYNLGVGFVRVGCIIMCAAVLVFGLSFLNIGGHLSYVGEIRAIITDMKVVKLNRGRIIADTFFPKYDYYVDLELYKDEGTRKQRQYVSEDTYREFVTLSELPEIHVKIYRNSSKLFSDSSDFYSIHELRAAEKEYSRVCPVVPFRTISFWVLIVGLPILFIGLGEERIAMKYPRSDVAIGETGIVLSGEETEDLLDEFEREYRKLHRNWVTDPPEKELPDGGRK